MFVVGFGRSPVEGALNATSWCVQGPSEMLASDQPEHICRTVDKIGISPGECSAWCIAVSTKFRNKIQTIVRFLLNATPWTHVGCVTCRKAQAQCYQWLCSLIQVFSNICDSNSAWPTWRYVYILHEKWRKNFSLLHLDHVLEQLPFLQWLVKYNRAFRQ